VSRRHRFESHVSALGAWCVITVLVAVTVARIVAWDRSELFAVLDAGTLWLYLPAWLVLGLAIWRRRWVMAAASLFMVLAQVIYVTPELTAASGLPPGAGRAPSFRVFDANVSYTNSNMSGYATEIRRDDPQLVALEEANRSDLTQLVASGALTTLPYRRSFDAGGSRDLVLASDEPLGEFMVAFVEGLPYLWRTTFEFDHHLLALWIVHTTAPTAPGVTAWNRELDGVRRVLSSHRPRRLLLVGDFNATWNNRGFRSILATGLTDAAAARGAALDMTWSQLLGPLPPLVRIDHVLTSQGLVVTSIHTQPGPGSDHRALYATVALLDSS
jgi:endonuclease/exonuclease/phosphatase (EEP) superfamily protein YafD